MTTKKKLRAEVESLEGQLTAQVDALHRSIIKCERVEHDLADAKKLTAHQRETIRSLTEKFEKAEDVNRTLGATITEIGKQNDCTGCAHIDENGKKLHPQKCATCRRGAKDNYTLMEATEA